MDVQVIHREGFTVVGLEIEALGFASGEKPSQGAINRQWGTFRERVEEIKQRVRDGNTYGLMNFPDNWQDGIPFTYLAGVAVSHTDDIPEGMVHRQVPTGTYGVVNYQGPLDDIGQIWQFFYRDWLPNSAYTQGDLVQFEFEQYEENWNSFTPETCQMTVWFPVAKK